MSKYTTILKIISIRMYYTNTKDNIKGMTEFTNHILQLLMKLLTQTTIINHVQNIRWLAEKELDILMSHCYSSYYFLVFRKKQNFTMRGPGCEAPDLASVSASQQWNSQTCVSPDGMQHEVHSTIYDAF